MSIRDALLRKPVNRQLKDGTPFVLRRPSALDLIEAIEVSKATPERLAAWLTCRHLIDDGQRPIFLCIEEVLAADGATVAEIAAAAEALYSEGRD
jgi:hypothetical protein